MSTPRQGEQVVGKALDLGQGIQGAVRIDLDGRGQEVLGHVGEDVPVFVELLGETVEGVFAGDKLDPLDPVETFDFVPVLLLQGRRGVFIQIDDQPQIVVQLTARMKDIGVEQVEKGKDQNGQADGEQGQGLGFPGLDQVAQGLLDDRQEKVHGLFVRKKIVVRKRRLGLAAGCFRRFFVPVHDPAFPEFNDPVAGIFVD